MHIQLRYIRRDEYGMSVKSMDGAALQVADVSNEVSISICNIRFTALLTCKR
jgi:hypothetical protein